jgi:membrane-bound lytic murein transglycosylase MltF
MSKYPKHGTSKSGWIDVKDKLPEIEQKVLVMHLDYYQDKPIMDISWIKEIRGQRIDWYQSCCCTGWTGDVTHWVELPRAPNE